MTRKESNQLNITKIKKMAKDSRTQEEYTFNSELTMKFYPIFPDSKIEDLLIDMQQVLIEQKEDEMSPKTLNHFLHFYCIKYFTNIFPTIKGGLKVHLDYMEALLDADGHYEEIMDDVFDPKQVQKVKDKVSKVIGAYQAMETMMMKAQEHFEKLDIQNRDVFKNVGKKQIPEK